MITLYVCASLIAFGLFFYVSYLISPNPWLGACVGLIGPIFPFVYLSKVSAEVNSQLERPHARLYPGVKNFVNSEVKRLLPLCFMDTFKWRIQSMMGSPNNLHAIFEFAEPDCFGNKMTWRIDLQASLADKRPGTEVTFRYVVTPIPVPNTPWLRQANQVFNRETCNKILAHTTATFDDFLK